MDNDNHYLPGQALKAAFKAAIPVAAMLILHILQISGTGFWELTGVFPRATKGLAGILTYPLVHASWEHLFNNTVPLLILGSILWYFYRKVAFKVYLGIWLISGLWLWAAARPAYHIGASGLVYGLAAFIASSGIIKKYYRLLALTLLVVFLYGGMIWYMFPIDTGISWEGHLFGALSGVVLAWYYRGEGPLRTRYDWEDEPDEEEEGDINAPFGDGKPYNDPITTRYRYVFRPENGDKDDDAHD